MNDLVSIIIPTFNNESSLHACLKSILSQTYKNIEILLIDNYSTDNTVKIAQRYLLKTKKLTIIKHMTNYDSQTILFGLKHINGKYILIASPENIYSLNFIEYAMQTLSTTKTSAFSCEFTTKNENILYLPFENDIVQKEEKTSVQSSSQFLNKIYSKRNFETTISLYNKIFDTSLFDELTALENPYSFNYSVLQNINNITVSNQILIIKVLIDLYYDVRCFSYSDFDLIDFIEQILTEKKNKLNDSKKKNINIVLLKQLLKIRKKFSFYYLDIENTKELKKSLDKKFNSIYRHYIKEQKTTDKTMNQLCDEYIKELKMERERERYPYLYC